MFLTTKLFIPPQPPGTLMRDRLYARLDSAWQQQARLILLSAPPGYGKTTLLTGWVQERGITCAWAALDPEDNDPNRFFLLLLHALSAHFPGLTDLAPILSVPRTPQYDDLITEVVNRTTQAEGLAGGDVLLAIDDYHLITSQTIHEAVQKLVNHLPPQLHLALLTREDPPLSLARLRARRQMAEVRAGDLAFDGQEVADLFHHKLNLPLESDQINVLHERTEGWAAGLQLAALALNGRSPEAVMQSFGGSHRFVLDYLASEVLERLSPDLREFLVHSAVLQRFSADLCDSALGLSNSRELINRAAGANLFLVPLDEENGWFRYHHLFADILKAENTPEARRAISLRAARWWRSQGHPSEAVQYALEAQAYEEASEIIRDAAISTAESGHLNIALSWLESLPKETLWASADLCIIHAWFYLFNGRFREAAQMAQEAAARFSDLSRPMTGLLDGMLAWMASVQGQPMDLARLQKAYAMTEDQYQFFSPMMLLAIGQAQREAGDFVGARRSFEEGADIAERTSGVVSALIIRNNLAFLLNESGERAAALQVCQDGIEQYSDENGNPGLFAGIPLIPYGCFLYESGRLEEAQSALTLAVNLVRRMGMYDILVGPANTALQNILADQGRTADAFALSKEVRRRAQKAGLAFVAFETELMEAFLRLLAGDPAPAIRWAQANPLPPDLRASPMRTTSIMMHARVLALNNQFIAAEELLLGLQETLAAWRMRCHWVRVTVELALVILKSAQSSRSPYTRAAEVLATAIEAAEPMDYRQIFIRYAAPLSPLFDLLRARYPQFIASACCSTAPAAPTPVLVESLTSREMDVLRLTAAGMSNGEIADHLYLTTGTVKWFLNQIYGKLEVNRRTEAVAKAREVGLL